ncbi:uncharacterized protein Dwil_GK27559 [Drosophila willistoni]|uniref:RING-type domain-containing protein n=2 Tax=Drosophila willistoni TaxID=7260 RepID=A0A0Q9WXF8_DROWI|nr:uncharacterized protein Dwil_GK27559 [Drosophila willistoni]
MQTVSMQKIATDFDIEIAKTEEKRKELLTNLSNQDANSSNLMQQMDQCTIQNRQLTAERDGLLVQLEELKQQKTIAQNKTLELIASLESIARDSQLKLSESLATNSALKLQSLQVKAENQMKLLHLQLSEKTQVIEINKLQLENQQLKTQLKKEEEGRSCPICLCPWQESGNHRLVTLPCGHLFGDGCVKAHLRQNSTCPLCRSRAKLNNLIYLFGFNASTSGN